MHPHRLLVRLHANSHALGRRLHACACSPLIASNPRLDPSYRLACAGVSRVVVGLPHPLRHLRGSTTAALRAAGVRVDVLGSSPCLASAASQQDALHACLSVNEVRSCLLDPAHLPGMRSAGQWHHDRLLCTPAVPCRRGWHTQQWGCSSGCMHAVCTHWRLGMQSSLPHRLSPC